MLGELIPQGGGDPIPLLEPKLLVGRRSSCDIVLGFPNVSSQHCELELINGYWHIKDLRSRNGIKVNGQRCDSKWLHPGDEVSIAKNHFEILYEPSGDAPPEEEDPFEMSLLEKAGLEQRKSEERRLALPPPARRGNGSASGSRDDSDEDDVLNWLMDD
jgi:pSer/pThr/pTyr-binding forkhead associated (FHA) protein